MAKPIRATPVLRGEDARRFIRAVIEDSRNPPKSKVANFKLALKEYEHFKKFLDL